MHKPNVAKFYNTCTNDANGYILPYDNNFRKPRTITSRKSLFWYCNTKHIYFYLSHFKFDYWLRLGLEYGGHGEILIVDTVAMAKVKELMVDVKVNISLLFILIIKFN